MAVVSRHVSAQTQVRTLIRQRLHADGISQRELSARICATPKHVSQSLNGVCGLSFGLAEQMLDALGYRLVVSVEPLSGGDPDA